MLRAVASDWRVVRHRHRELGQLADGDHHARISAFTGVTGQRVNQVNDDPYGDKSLTNYLNAAAFAFPAAGTLGDHARQEHRRSRLLERRHGRRASACRWAAGHTLEFRVEAFNLMNNFNWGDPNTSLDAGTFGRITTQNGDSRIMQFAVKYGF